jgi:serine phosphatase RsbU (regulator of sigma subunit)/RsiW-degrading membrane proteinase PrsW (M82 family)
MIVLFNGLLLAWVLLDPYGDRLSAIVLNAAGFVGPLLVLPLCLGGLLEWMRRRRASRIGNQSAAMTGQRLAPILLGMGILCYVLGQMGFTYYDLVLRQAPPFPSLADVGYLMEYPFFLLGILLLPARPIPVASRARIALDGLMIMTAAVTFSWYFVLGPVIEQGTETALAKAVATAYPLADIVLIACLVILALRPGEHTLRGAVYVLAFALGFLVVNDSIYGYQTLNDTYVTGTIFDVGWPVAYMLIGLGAFAVRLAPAATPDETSRATTPLAGQGVWRSLLPFALVPAVGVLALYAWRASAGNSSLAVGVYLGGTVLICLVLLRQVLTIVENAHLYNRLQGTYLEMEKKNDQLVRSQNELRRQEGEVRQLNKDLEKRVAERTEQLKIAMAKQQEEAQERERIEQELRVARLIQQTLLPKSLPQLPGYDVAAFYRPAREVGGDFYELLELEDGRLGVVVGDATGHGVPAALMMANTQSVLRAVAQRGGSEPGRILAEVNEVLLAYIPPSMFVTCFYGVLDPESGRFRYANAGHNLPCCSRRHAEQAATTSDLSARGMPLGLMPGMSYEENETLLASGEGVLFYTDGLVEAHNPQGEMFGTPRLRDLLSEHPMSGADPCAALMEELERFTGEGWEQEDDITLLTLERSASRS